MTKFKDFGSPVSHNTPIKFKLFKQEFTAVPDIPGKFLLELVGATQDDKPVSMDLILEFFERVLDTDSYKRFDALLESKDTVVTSDTLVAVIEWLIEQYSDRPETQPGA